LRNEYTYPLTRDEFDKFISDGIPLSFIALDTRGGNGAAGDNNIRFIGKLITFRNEIPLGQITDCVIELDKNDYAETTDYELECEYESETEPTELAAFLSEHNIPAGISESKYGRLLEKLKSKK